MDQDKLKTSFFFLHWLKHLNFSNFFFDKGSQNQSSVIKVHHIQHVITRPRAWTEYSSVFILYYHTYLMIPKTSVGSNSNFLINISWQ